MRSAALFLTATMTFVAFSGCLLALDEDETAIEDYVIAKKVTVNINDDTEDADRFEEVVKTRMEYRHHGADVAPSALTASYTAENGAARTDPLSRFTGAALIKNGDLITINGVNLTSGLVIKQGDTLVAERGGLSASWFKVENIPLPVRSTQEGVALYGLFSEAKVQFEATNFEADEEMFIERVKGSARAAMEGTSTIRTRVGSIGPRLELVTEAKPDIDFLVEARVNQEGRTYDAGARIYDDRGSFNGEGMLQFDAAHRLQRGGWGGSQFFDMRVQVWDQDHPRSSNYEPDDVEHPLVDERQEYREEEVGGGDEFTIDQWAIDFLTRLWSMEVGVGDDYRLHFEEKGSEYSPAVTFDFIIQVAADDERTIAGKVIPTHRVSQRAALIVKPQGKDAADFDIFRSTYWIARDSHLPVYVQSSHSQTFSREKILSLFEFMGEEAPKRLPDAAKLILTEKTTVALKEYSGNFAISPIVGLIAANQGWFTGIMGAASVFMLASDIGSETAEPAPVVSFSYDETMDRIQVLSSASGADWSRLTVGLTQAPSNGATVNVGADDGDDTYVNEAAFAGTSANNVLASSGTSLSSSYRSISGGDFIEFCGSQATSAIIEVRDQVANSVLYRVSLSSIAAC